MSEQSSQPAFVSEDVIGVVYAQLRAIAQKQMNCERAEHTLTATALVHEALLRLEDHPITHQTGLAKDAQRLAFVAAAGEAMRRILIEHARRRGSAKRGGGVSRRRIDLDPVGEVADLASDSQSDAVIALDEAFARLEKHGERLAQVVRLRFFAGLTVAETALALGVSERTVNNDWAYARAWLSREIQSGEQSK